MRYRRLRQPLLNKKLDEARSKEAPKSLSPAQLTVGDAISYLKQSFSTTDDLIIKNIKLGTKLGVVVYLETTVDKDKVQKYVLTPMLQADRETLSDVLISECQISVDFHESIQALISGSCLIFFDGDSHVYFADVSLHKDRDVTEPVNEQVVLGAHEGFVENLYTNLNLLRKKIKSPDLSLQYFSIGHKTKTKVAIVYLNGVADDEVLQEIRRRMEGIHTDALTTAGYLEEFIEDSSLSIFPQTLSTERTDRVVANLNEGRVALLMDGSPVCLLLPVTFFAFYQSPDDYNTRWMPGTFIRALRLMSFTLSIVLPSFYIAVVAFHFEVLPDELVMPVKNSIHNIPFPPLVEALIMELTIELIREAGIRLPLRIGQTIGIVGGLVIGDAIVRAGLISNVMIVVVALTAIASFVVPNHEMSATVRLLRFPFMFLAATFGFVGIVFGFMTVIAHLCKLESFGKPYFAPLAPLKLKDLKDTFFRLPAWTIKMRPTELHPKEKRQQWSTRGWIYHDRQQK
ncbi:spore germination protein [Halalkalibacterium halodurans]|uniref:spore germination protein n=1 Tax=Halalkalibacterium halodurans TaxID=86665 RepID=UPI002AA97A2A|nr:spore germination protein [Halalkalibacterium halodurans]MDY7221217.1 spore germination protein [Halalkalibacterium halodurans]MDY7240456.1 spore germination protein [Halalkalibacterium halodurans]